MRVELYGCRYKGKHLNTANTIAYVSSGKSAKDTFVEILFIVRKLKRLNVGDNSKT